MPGIVLPTLSEALDIGAVVLVCDFALGHLAKRLATKANVPIDSVHRQLLPSRTDDSRRAGLLRLKQHQLLTNQTSGHYHVS